MQLVEVHVCSPIRLQILHEHHSDQRFFSGSQAGEARLGATPSPEYTVCSCNLAAQPALAIYGSLEGGWRESRYGGWTPKWIRTNVPKQTKQIKRDNGMGGLD